ncbi:mitogen-activated protein kinase kinase kinase 19 [Elgaria multicarinata webbii]|uniref:mitogen-activated protein kinase kinase kinase 19 n=1 Tax=Elgaria multicarinata webbii TaxID=159646 RepID=UPI002FCD66BE
MVQLPLLKDNTKKKSDRNDLPSILNSHSVSSKHIDSQSDSQWERDPKQSKNQIPIGMSDSFSVTRDPHPLTLDNYCISFGCSKAKEPELHKTEADIKYEVCSGETHQVSVTSENLSIISKDCVFDPDGYFSPSEIVREECEGPPSRHTESFKVKTWRKKLTTRCDPNLYHNVDVKNVMVIEPGNADADSSFQSKAIQDHTLANTIPNALMDLEQSESSFCATADSRMVKNVTDFETTEGNITEASPIHITTSRHGPPQVPKASSRSARRNSMPPNLSQSFNIFAHKESDRYKVNSNRTNSALKAKICTTVSQDFIILGKSSIQHQTNKIKNPISRSLGLSCEEAGVSSKFQRRHLQQEKCHQKSPKQALPSISNNSASSGEAIAPFPVRQVHSSVGFLDLKYSDMFKEINSNDKGPGIYEMFGTPVYSRKPDEHENRYCRNVHSAPARRRNVSKHKSNHCSGKSSRMRNVQKRIYPKSHKNPLAIKHMQKVLVPKEATEFEGRCPEPDEGVTVSGTEQQQIKTDGSTAPFHEVVDQQLLVSTEPAKQYEIIPNSKLSPIEEVSLEYTSDVDDTSSHKAFATSVHELLWPEVKVHAKYAPFLSCEKDEPKNPGKNGLIQGKPETTTCLVELEASPVLCFEENQAKPSALTFLDRINSPLPDRQIKNVSLANISTKQSCHPVNLVSQTYANIMSYENTEEITEDIFCYSVAEQLSLDGADGNCSGAVTKNADVETQHRNGNAENKDDSAANVRNSKNFCMDFLESSNENRFLNVTTFSENSLTDEDPILWTKGEILGKGAYGTVYCGLTSQGHLIAVKQVALNTHDQAGNEKEYQKLQEEVEILKNLTHINIVGYLGTGLEDNIVSIFMEFVPGGSLSSIIRRFGPLSEIVFCKYTKQILEGVAYLHENCVVHRDIKGNNIMLMPNGVIKLIDFGCAKRLACVSLTNTHSEPIKSVHGTPYWMAPEVINESGYGRKSDIWSTGCTIFEMATGKPPLASMDRIAAMFYIGAHRGLMPSLPKHCSKKADDFVHLCLTRDQCERPSALQLLQHPFITRNS